MLARPDHSEALEHGWHRIVEREGLRCGARDEVPVMQGEPVLARARALTLVPGEGRIYLIERLHLDGPGAPDGTRPVGAVEHHDVAADPRHRLAAVLDVAQQAG